MAEEQSAEHLPVTAHDRNGEIAAHRQVPFRHAKVRCVVAVAGILRDIVQADGALAVKRRRKHFGGARMRELVERLLRRARQRVQHVGLARLLVDHVVEERAELGGGELGRDVGHLLDDGVAIEVGRQDGPDFMELGRDRRMRLCDLEQAHTFGDVTRHFRGADQIAGLVADGRHGQRDVEPATVLALPHGFVMFDGSARADILDDRVFLAEQLLGNDHPDVAPDRLRRRVAEDALGRPVPRQDGAVEGLADNRVIRRFNDASEMLGIQIGFLRSHR